jgi:hypothetical protein
MAADRLCSACIEAIGKVVLAAVDLIARRIAAREERVIRLEPVGRVTAVRRPGRAT